MSKKELTDESLLELSRRFVDGDTEAFADLYEYYIDNLYRFIYFKTDSSEAEDLTEVVFLKVWENRFKFDPAKSKFSTWLYTVARNTVIDAHRTKKEFEELSEDIVDKTVESPAKIVEQRLKTEMIKEAINKLQPAFRDLLILRFIDDLSYAEIAKILKKSEGALRILQFRAMRDLKVVLERMGFNQ